MTIPNRAHDRARAATLASKPTADTTRDPIRPAAAPQTQRKPKTASKISAAIPQNLNSASASDLHRVFASRVKALDADDWWTDDDEEDPLEG